MDADAGMWQRRESGEAALDGVGTPEPRSPTDIGQPEGDRDAEPAPQDQDHDWRPQPAAAPSDAHAETETLRNPFPRADASDPFPDTEVREPRPPSPPPPSMGQGGGRGRGWPMIVAAALVSALVSTGMTLGLTQALDERQAPAVTEQPAAAQQPGDSAEADPELLPTVSSVADVAEAMLPSVARVDINGSAGTGSGSAVVYNSDGYLVTNNHVVQGAGEVSVTLPDTQVVRAQVVGTDPASDLAVLRIDRTGLQPPTFATEQPRPGDTAIAIGSPFGLDSTVTSGIISATERDVNAPGATLVGMLQTDAAINPGNSGGALANDRGELIGINTAILSRTGQSGGIGFAIPVSTVQTVAEQLIQQGFVEYAYLGVSTQDLNEGVAAQLGLESAEGALVGEVIPGSAADAAGLVRGDVIVALDDQRITSPGDLVGAVRNLAPGDQGTVIFVRDGQEQQATVTFGTRPAGG